VNVGAVTGAVTGAGVGMVAGAEIGVVEVDEEVEAAGVDEAAGAGGAGVEFGNPVMYKYITYTAIIKIRMTTMETANLMMNIFW
jgi:hypothetical protein